MFGKEEKNNNLRIVDVGPTISRWIIDHHLK